MRITPRNWREFQHYKDRSPPWIRLHRKLLDDFDFHCLPVASRALAPMLWLLASDNVDGCIDAQPARLAFRLRMQESELIEAIKPLIEGGFFELEEDASGVLAPCKQSAVPETETETLQSQRTETAGAGAPAAVLDGSKAKQKREPKHKDTVTEDELVALGVERQHAKDWLKVRRVKDLALTRTALELVQSEASKAGMTLPQAIARAAAEGWAGFKASWINGSTGGGASPRTPPPDNFAAKDYGPGGRL